MVDWLTEQTTADHQQKNLLMSWSKKKASSLLDGWSQHFVKARRWNILWQINGRITQATRFNQSWHQWPFLHSIWSTQSINQKKKKKNGMRSSVVTDLHIDSNLFVAGVTWGHQTNAIEAQNLVWKIQKTSHNGIPSSTLQYSNSCFFSICFSDVAKTKRRN